MNITNTAKQKMLSGKPVFGWSLGLGSALAAERMAATGIDFVMIDGQHGSWGTDAMIPAFLAIAAHGAYGRTALSALLGEATREETSRARAC